MKEYINLMHLVLTVLSALGGGALIVLGFSSWLGKVWANKIMAKDQAKHEKELESLRYRLEKDIHSYQMKLKKSEFLFQKEFEAASELVWLIRKFLPSSNFPGFEWGDACDELALSFKIIEQELNRYLSKHGAVLEEAATELISDCIYIASENKFKTDHSFVPVEVNSAANQLYRKLIDAKGLLLTRVRSQSNF